MKNPAKRATSLDLRKAFDTVNHKHLLNLLLNLGFRGPVQELMSSYLSNRSQNAGIGYELSNEISSWENIGVRAPQGSVLRPLLFFLYKNEITQFSDGLHSILSGDDTVLLNVMNKSIHYQKHVNDAVG